VLQTRVKGEPVEGPPGVNISSDNYTVEKGAIRVSPKQLKGMAEEALESVLLERAKGRFTTLRDFVLRTNTSQPIIENLIKVGAFDSLGDRIGLLAQVPGLMNLKHKAGKGARPLFEDTPPEQRFTPSITRIDNADVKAKMLIERELLSLDLSAHPLDFFHLKKAVTRVKDLHSVATGKTVKIMGSVIRYQTPPTRNGNRVVYVIMEDGTGVADVTVFGSVQEKCGEVLFRAGWLTVRGKVQRRGPKALSIIAEELSPVDMNVATI